MTTTLERPTAPDPLPDSPVPAPSGRGATAWAVRWRLALRLAARNARRNRLSTGIATTMIALPVAAATFLLAFLASESGSPTAQFTASYGPHAQAALFDVGCGGCEVRQNASGSSTGWGEPVAGDEPPTTSAIRSALPGATVVERSTGSFVMGAGEVVLGVRDVTALPAEWIDQVYRARTGRLPEHDGEAALFWRDAERLGVGAGDRITVGGVELTVSGIIDSRNRPSASVVTVPGRLELTSASWLVFGNTPVTWQDVLALNELGVQVASRAVAMDPPDVPDELGGSTDTLRTVGLVAAVAVIAVIEAVLLVGPAFAVGARRQTAQLALVAACGGSRRDLRRTVLASGVVIGLVAGVTGVVIGVAALAVLWWRLRSGWNPLPAFVVPVAPVAAVVGFAVGLGLLASLVPARAVSRLDVVAALGGRRAEAAAPRHLPWLGMVLAVAGLAASVAGAFTGMVALLVGGIVLLELGMVMATGGLLTAVARLAPRLGVAGRFALRDAVRQRSRTVPAVASIVAAVAAVAAGAVYLATDDRIQAASWQPEIGVGTIAISGDYLLPPEDLSPRLADAVDLIGQEVPLTGWAEVRGLRTAPDGTTNGYLGSSQNVWLEVLVDPAQRCPADEYSTAAEWEEYRTDPRCLGRAYTLRWYSSFAEGTIVDDGSAVGLFTADGAAAAAEALASGHIVVLFPDEVWPDGTAHVEVRLGDPADPDAEAQVVELVAPAHVADLGNGRVMLPTSLVAQHPELDTVPMGAVARPAVPFDQSWVDRVQGERGGAMVSVKEPYVSVLSVVLVVFVGVAAVVALAATWLSVALAGAETRPDLATLAAVGAPPRTTRRIAAAQAAVVAVIGVWVGVLLGLALGWVLSQWTLRSNARAVEAMVTDVELPGVIVPWLWLAVIALAIPLKAVAGAWLTAPRRLALARRVAQ